MTILEEYDHEQFKQQALDSIIDKREGIKIVASHGSPSISTGRIRCNGVWEIFLEHCVVLDLQAAL